MLLNTQDKTYIAVKKLGYRADF